MGVVERCIVVLAAVLRFENWDKNKVRGKKKHKTLNTCKRSLQIGCCSHCKQTLFRGEIINHAEIQSLLKLSFPVRDVCIIYGTFPGYSPRAELNEMFEDTNLNNHNIQSIGSLMESDLATHQKRIFMGGKVISIFT